MQNAGSRYRNPRSGPREHPVTNLKHKIMILDFTLFQNLNLSQTDEREATRVQLTSRISSGSPK